MVYSIPVELKTNNDKNALVPSQPLPHNCSNYADSMPLSATPMPSGFSPPMSTNKRAPKVDVVLTANARCGSISSSRVIKQESPFSTSVPNRPTTRNVTLRGCDKMGNFTSAVGNESATGRIDNERRNGPLSRDVSKSSIRGSRLPIPSIAVDFDLAAKEEKKIQYQDDENDISFSQQPNQETMKQIDAVMTAGAVGDHEDDTDLGFDFANSPSRNDDCFSGMLKGSPMSQSKANLNLGSETPSNRANHSNDSFPLPSPPKPPFFRQQQHMNQGHRAMHMQAPHSSQNSRQIHHSYDKFTPRYQNNPTMPNKLQPNPYVQNMMYYTPAGRYSHSGNENGNKFQPQGTKGDHIRQPQQYIQTATHKQQLRLNNRAAKGEKEGLVVNLSPGARDKMNDPGKSSTKTKTLLRSPPPKKRKVEGYWEEQNRKRDIDVVPIGTPKNVFRSPKNNYKRSPILTNASISFGGSFDMDASPNQKFDEMFPASTSFEIGDNIIMSDDMIMDGTDPQRQKKTTNGSNSLMFDTVFSPLRGSPVHKRNMEVDRNGLGHSLDIFHTFEESPLPPTEQSPTESMPKTGVMKISNPSPLPSKHQTVQGSGMRQPLNKNGTTFGSPRSFGVQIHSGSTVPVMNSMKQVEGSNKIRKSQLPQLELPIGNMRPMKTTTPIKNDPVTVSTPSTAMKMNAYPHPARLQPPSSMAHPSFPINTMTAPPTPNDGKENQSPKEQQRTPCNCKKSNCLKLYCVCFQAKLYCDGCNCIDCNNTKDKEEIRQKAIKDTIAKNPNAFKPRFSSKKDASHDNPNPNEGHNMGCKCKKSQCLKKYCECFEAGVTCSDKCKCIECQNYVGSQQLIDRRRKIKDHKGAEMAMRSSHDAWKNGFNQTMRNPMTHPPTVYPSPSPRISQFGVYPMTMISPSPPGGPIRPGSIPTHFLSRSQMLMTTVGYSPMGMQPVTPAYATSKPQQGTDLKPKITPTSFKYYPQQPQPRRDKNSQSKKAPTRKKFDVQNIRANLKGDEENKQYFGKSNVAQKKETSLTIFSFLSNDDLYNASLVCKGWNKLFQDEALWLRHE